MRCVRGVLISKEANSLSLILTIPQTRKNVDAQHFISDELKPLWPIITRPLKQPAEVVCLL